MNILLEAKELSVSIVQGEKYRKILDGVNFKIKSRKFTALMGRSGSGKTLIIKAILGFLTPPRWKLEGDIIFYQDRALNPKTAIETNHPAELVELPENRNLLEEKWEEKREEKYEKKYILKNGQYQENVISELRGKCIFTILQGPDSHLHPSLNVKWQIREVIRRESRDKVREEINNRLQCVDLSPAESGKYPHQFSQGQRQRIMIAMALGQADLIIADEPTSSLDIKVQSEIILLLKQLKEQKKINSLFLITHDLKVIKELFNTDEDILVLDEKTGGGIGIVETTTLGQLQPHPLLEPQDYTCFKQTEHTAPSMARIILKVIELKQGYRKGLFGSTTPILNGIDLEVKEGEWVGVVGKSGCGKTTLVKAIARLLPKTTGEIRYYSEIREKYKCINLIKVQPDGLKPDTDIMRNIRRKIQVIFQDCASLFNPRMTIGELLSETLAEILKIKDPKEKTEIINDSLLQLGICKDGEEIANILSRYPGELSGGERQRLAIARVFLLKPRLIIADEPFADQDVLSKRKILEMMDKMRKNNHTAFIIVSHELDLLHDVCDRSVTFDKQTDNIINNLIREEVNNERFNNKV